jgi:Ca2+-binding RTX toxin-like protein
VEWLSTADNNATAAINLTGNALAQYLVGNAGANVLAGGGGADVLIGLGGNDSYLIESGAAAIVEGAGQGFDSAFVGTSYALAPGVEVEWLSTIDNNATTAINLTGNAFANYLIGNAGANVLDGGAGADLLYGLAGNDTYVVDNAGDLVTEHAGQGFDAVYATVSYALAAGQEVEWLSTADNAGTAAIDLTGNALGQILVGNAGANILDGGAGADTLIGGAGADNFRFATALGGGNVDVVADFVSGTDKVALDDAIFTAIGAPGALAAGAFATGTAAGDADDRIVYNSTTGQLFYDADGNGGGGAILFATLTGAPTLAASDFVVF